MKYVIIMLFYMFLSSSCAKKTKVWLEKDGYVMLEAEEVDNGIPVNSDFRIMDQPKGFWGAGYVRWEGTSMVGEGTSVVDYDSIEPSRSLVYYVKISLPGKYFLKVRNFHQQRDGDNDCFTSISKGKFEKTYDWNENEFTWCETGPWRSTYLPKGIHEIALGGRSKGFGVDQIVLFHELLAPPVDQWKKGAFKWIEDYQWSTAGESETHLMDLGSRPRNR